MIGDLDYMAKTLSLPRWSKQDSPCALCQCKKHGAASYFDNRYPGAGWLDTLWDFYSWKRWGQRSKCHLFSLSWMSALNVAYDWMHAKYLGSDQYIYGSCMFLLVYHILPGSPQQNLDILWRWMKSYYKKHKPRVRYNSFCKLTMFKRKKDFPKLRGKAAEVKAFGPVLLEMWGQFSSKRDTQHKQIKLLLKKNVKVDQTLASHPTSEYYRLPEGVHEEFVSDCFAVAQIHKQLGEWYSKQENPIRIFNMTAKSHCVLHIALAAEFVHPGLTWCYSGEDFMRVVQVLLQSCVRGNQPFATMNKACKHYNLGSQLRWAKEAKK